METREFGFGTKRPRARYVPDGRGRARGFTVTDGAIEVHTDLRRHWSGPSAALIPKLVVRHRRGRPRVSANLVTK
jgi:hypothetical protein